MMGPRSALPTLGARLGAHHFAYLRAIAEGVGSVEAARRYLAIEHGAEAAGVHRLVVDRVRALARRRGDPRWRLIGLELQDAVSAAVSAPSLDAWAATEGLGDWSEDELQAMYAERFGPVDAGRCRRQARNARLRARRLQLLRELEAVAADKASATDLVDVWLPAALATQLRGSFVLTLGDLQACIARGGRWWTGLRAFGPVKAGRLAALVQMLLGPPAGAWPVSIAAAELTRLSGAQGANRMPGSSAAIAAQDDLQAIRAWIAARAGSPATAKQYEREAERFVLWCVLERHKGLSDAAAEDCRAYMDFLANLPGRWISRRKVGRMQPGWAPFRGALTLASQRLAVAVLHSLFGWLVQARYLGANPWVLVNRKLGDDAEGDDDVASRAFTPAAWAALHARLDASPPSPSVARLRWLCVFVQSVGLRAAELLRARRAHLKELRAGWVIRVHGKGRRNRTVPVPRVAIEATRVYFERRGLRFEAASPEAPLLAALDDAMAPITYSALHQTFTRFVRRAVGASGLPLAEQERAQRASAHWLRHTYATRAAERDMPLDVLQENLGQSDPRTAGRYYRAQLERRQLAVEDAFKVP
jgi:integrase